MANERTNSDSDVGRLVGGCKHDILSATRKNTPYRTWCRAVKASDAHPWFFRLRYVGALLDDSSCGLGCGVGQSFLLIYILFTVNTQQPEIDHPGSDMLYNLF
jgi:hypothetical protein